MSIPTILEKISLTTALVLALVVKVLLVPQLSFVEANVVLFALAVHSFEKYLASKQAPVSPVTAQIESLQNSIKATDEVLDLVRRDTNLVKSALALKGVNTRGG